MAKQHAPRFLALVEDAKSRIQECDVAAVRRRIDGGENFALIDVREESEYAAGHIPKAEWIGKGILERDIEKKHPDVNESIVLYCGGGFRSALAADALRKMGYRQVISMDGGWSGWKDSGGAVEV